MKNKQKYKKKENRKNEQNQINNKEYNYSNAQNQ